MKGEQCHHETSQFRDRASHADKPSHSKWHQETVQRQSTAHRNTTECVLLPQPHHTTPHHTHTTTHTTTPQTPTPCTHLVRVTWWDFRCDKKRTRLKSSQRVPQAPRKWMAAIGDQSSFSDVSDAPERCLDTGACNSRPRSCAGTLTRWLRYNLDYAPISRPGCPQNGVVLGFEAELHCVVISRARGTAVHGLRGHKITPLSSPKNPHVRANGRHSVQPRRL